MAYLTISEFARESRLTQKALRLYDDLGLLPPAHVDPHSGYRLYEHEQLERARLIAWLRRLGMPLARIRVVCDLSAAGAAAEVTSYWRQVEADTAARKELAAFLVDHLSRRSIDMVDENGELDIRYAVRCARGLVRERNEDATFGGGRLLAVADGFGAREEEATASFAAIDALRPLDSKVPSGDLLNLLGEAASEARTAVKDFAASEPERHGAGTTLTAMLWSGAQLALVHVGDSRAYLWRDDDLVQITHDHTFVQSLVDEGRLTPEEAASHPERATLVRAFHHAGTAEPDLHLREARAGDRYLLCTDGLHAVLGEHQVREVLAGVADPEAAVDTFVDLVHDSGAPDNVACAVADVTTRSTI